MSFPLAEIEIEGQLNAPHKPCEMGEEEECGQFKPERAFTRNIQIIPVKCGRLF